MCCRSFCWLDLQSSATSSLLLHLGLPDALLPCLPTSIDALVQAIESYYDSYRRVFRRLWPGKKEKLEKATDQPQANNHDLVSASLQPFFDPFWISSTDIDSSSSSSGCSSSTLSPSTISQMQHWRWRARSATMSKQALPAVQMTRSQAGGTSCKRSLMEGSTSGGAC